MDQSAFRRLFFAVVCVSLYCCSSVVVVSSSAVPLSFVSILSTGATAVTIKAAMVDVLAGNQSSQSVSQFSFTSTYPKFVNNDMSNFATLLAAFTANAPAPANTTAIILDGTTQSTNGLSYLAAYYKIPMVSCSINPANFLLQESVYPYVISNYTPDRLLVDSFFEMAVQLGWNRVAVFATLESTGITLLSYLYQRMAAYPQIDIVVFYVAYPDATQFKTSTLTQLAAMKQQQYYIGFLGLYKANMVTFLNYAYSAGMTGPPYQWIGINGICSSTGNIISASLVTPAAGLGVLCLLQGMPHSIQQSAATATTAAAASSNSSAVTAAAAGGNIMSYTEFLWRFNGQGGINFATQLLPWSTCYDAVYLIANGLQTLAAVPGVGIGNLTNNGTQLLAAMKNVAMTGPASTFPISFDSTGQLSSSAVDLYQYLPHPDLTYTKWSYVGTYSDVVKQWRMVADITFWSAQGNTAPLDYVPVLSDGSRLDVTYNAVAGVVPAAILLVSLWTSGITLRYAVINKRRSRHPIAARSRLRRCCPASVIELLHWPSSVFVLLASLQFAFGAVIAFHYATFSLQDVTSPFSPLSFTNNSLVGACCLAAVTSYVSFLLSYMQVEYHSLAARDVVGDSSKIDSRSQTADNSLLKAQKADKLQKRLQKASTFILVRWLADAAAVVAAMSPQTAVAAAFLAATVCAPLHVAVGGFILPAETSVKAGVAVIAPLLLLFPAFCYCCHARAHMLDTSTGVKCLLLSAVVMQLEHVMDAAAYSFSFSQSQYADPSSLYNSATSGNSITADNVLVFCSVIAAFVIFCWLGLTMHVNQMSKGILDLLLLQAQNGRSRAESELKAAQDRRQRTLELVIRLRKYAAINAGARPLYREYALGLDLNRLQDNSAPEAGTQIGSDGIVSPMTSGVVSPKTGERTLLARRPSDGEPGTPGTPDSAAGLASRLGGRLTSNDSQSQVVHSVASILPQMRSPSVNVSTLRNGRAGNGQHTQQPRQSRQQQQQQQAFSATDANTQLIMTMYQEIDSAELLDRWHNFSSSPLQPAVVRSISMQDLLSHPVTLEMVKDTALARQQEDGRKGLLETVTAWLDIQRYRQTTDRAVRSVLAKEIISTFFLEPCPHPVTISPQQRKLLVVNLKQYRDASPMQQPLQQPGAHVPSTGYTASASASSAASSTVAALNLFNAAEQELYVRMSEEVLPAMRSSTMFHACALLLARVELGQGSNQAQTDENGDM